MNEMTKVLSALLGRSVEVMHCANAGGGDIHRSYCVELIDAGEVRQVFVKSNHKNYAPLLEAELEALLEIEQRAVIKTPNCLGLHAHGDQVYLALQWLDLKSRGDDFALGCQLATLHQATHTRFGWHCDNFIGYSKQQNSWANSWSEFWLNCRLQPQLELASSRGFSKSLQKNAQPLLEASAALLAGHEPKASLLHGDFWGGNKAFLADGQPVIFDPASYYGDREVDLAMAGLFGGFTQDFYDGYQSVWPLAAGCRQRKVLYNLYHQLNHVNMFGASYLGECLRAIKGLVGESVAEY